MNGKDWESILDELHMQGFTHRTKENIISLYSKVNQYIFQLIMFVSIKLI
jgi:hypothetical protein